MKVKSVKLQQGGQMPEGQPATQEQQAPGQGGGNEQQIMQIAQEIINQLGPEAALLLAQAIAQLLQGQPQAPAYARKGGKLVRIV